MSDLIVNVRQISNYPALDASGGSEAVLVQQTGLGGPYASISAAKLVATALEGGTGPLGVGVIPPPDTDPAGIFTASASLTGAVLFNAYSTGSQFKALTSGLVGTFNLDPALGWQWAIGYGAAQAPVTISDVMELTVAGALRLYNGTLTVARDPATAFEVATLNYVGNNTVASFNNRKGQVTLTAADVYQALCLCDPIATQPWVQQAITNGIQNLLTTCPFVNRWNGRTGSVYLMLTDITTVFYQPGQQPISPTPLLTSNDDSIATTNWVTEYIAQEFAGSGGNLATQAWVLANTVNSFNGRQGPVTLTAADVFDVGAASLNSPNFSGVPTAPTAAVGQSTGQIATTAFVQQAITNNTAGVSTFMGRSGDVLLLSADVQAAGGLINPSATLTGNPTAPTQPPGTNLPVLATCEFVQAAVNATVTSFNTRTGAVVLTTADITGAGGAPLVSPNFSSIPTAPTAAPGTNTVQLATCAFVTQAVTAAGGVSSFNGRTGAVDLIPNDISAAGGLVNPSVNLTGAPTATNATAGDNSTRIATTAFVTTALSTGTVQSFNTRTGAVVLTAADITNAGGAVLASPAFTGAPTAPTATAVTNNTQIATTQFVHAAILSDASGVTSFNTRTGAVVLTTADITGAGGAPLASPSFTGTPLGPTAAPGTSTTQLATTSFVMGAIASSGVSSFNSRTGAVTLIANDISAAGGAVLASPTFTGVPAAPTATVGTNTTQIATTAYVMAAIRQPATVAPLMDGTAAVGTSLLYARQDHVHPTDTSRAPLASPTFTGTPVAPTATTGTNTTQLATTAFVANNFLSVTGGTVSGAVSFNAGLTVGDNGIVYGSGNPGILFGAIGGYGLGPSLSLTVQGQTNVSDVVTTGTGTGFSPVPQIALAGGSSEMYAWYSPTQSVTWGITFSDRRLKTNIRPATTDALAVVDALTVYDCDLTPPFTDAVPQHWSCALLADEVGAVIPEAYVEGRGTTSYDTLRELPLVATLVRAVQQLLGRLAACEARLVELGA